jgi:hypothetical protein
MPVVIGEPPDLRISTTCCSSDCGRNSRDTEQPWRPRHYRSFRGRHERWHSLPDGGASVHSSGEAASTSRDGLLCAPKDSSGLHQQFSPLNYHCIPDATVAIGESVH